MSTNLMNCIQSNWIWKCTQYLEIIWNDDDISFQEKFKYKEHVTKGFENMAQAFIGLFKGENTGKAIVRVWRSRKHNEV